MKYRGYSIKILFVLLVFLSFLTGCGKEERKPEKKETMQLEQEKETKIEQETVFTSDKIVPGDEVYERIYGKSYKENEDIKLEDLRYLRMSYVDFEGETQVGEMIVHKDIAKAVLEIFEELYEAEYPIERIQLVDDFDAEDAKSMEANNSSAFNYRKIANSDKLSNHSFGKAIDINPKYNPYVYNYNGQSYVEPECGRDYADRQVINNYMINHEDLCYKLFVKHGFIWGGDWNTRKDYQHFEMEE